MTTVAERRARFRALHESSQLFVMPNPWDAGSARALEQLGFPALATTSAGMAWTLGRADNQVTLDEALTHLREIAGAVTAPVNADFEGGFAVEPEQSTVAIVAHHPQATYFGMKSGRLLPPEKAYDEVIRGTPRDPMLRAVPDAA